MIEPKRPRGIIIDRHFFMDRPVPVYPNRLEQALVSLLNNAMQAIPDEGTVRISTRPKGALAEIEVSDTGRGIDPKTLENIFSPAYTLYNPGRGSGLGLAIAQSIVEMHDGRINVESEVGRGSTFTIELPL
jgi:signal transduction histidine kinase